MPDHLCECDHGEPQNGECGAIATYRHRHAGRGMWVCDPCNTECHNRENER